MSMENESIKEEEQIKELEDELLGALIEFAYINGVKAIRDELERKGYKVLESCDDTYYGDGGVGSPYSYEGYCAVHVIVNGKQYHVYVDWESEQGLSVWLSEVK